MKLLHGISKLAITLIVIVLVIVAGVAVYFTFSRPSVSPPTPTPSLTPTTTPTDTPSPTITPTPSLTPTTTPTDTPSPTPIEISEVEISGVRIRVPNDFAEFVKKVKQKDISITIYFGHALAPEERPAFEKVINMFKSEFPGVEVRVLAYGDAGGLQSAISAAGALPREAREALIGNAPDVFTWAHDWIGWMADSGYLLALEDYIGYDAIEDISEHILPSAMAAVTYGGKTYGLPYAGEALALFINTKLVAKIPETFDELKQVMQQFCSPDEGRYGIAGQIGSMYHINAWVTAFGGYWYDEITKSLGINSSATKQGVKFFIENVLRYMDVTDLGHDYQRRLFGEGKAPIYVSGPWDVSFAINSLGIENFAVAPFPKIDGRTPKPWSGFRNLYLSVMAEAGGKDRIYASVLFVLYVSLNDNSILTLVKENGYVPVKLSVAHYINTHLEEHQIFKIVMGFYRQLEASTPMPKDRNMQKVWGADIYIQAILHEYSKALSEGASPDAAVSRALDVVDSNLDQAQAEISKQIADWG
ncbi:MAG: extracellular solute-binding protein [Ignisphaera sp.]